MAVFVVSDRRSVGTGYWIPLREVQGLYGGSDVRSPELFSGNGSGGLFVLFGSLRAAKRAAQSSRPWWVVLSCCWSSKRDERLRDNSHYQAS